MDQTTQNAVLAFIGIGIVALIIFAATRKRSGNTNTATPWHWAPPGRYEVAQIEERVSMTGGGVFAIALLVLHNLFMVLMFFGTAKSAIQEASLGTIWIAGNIVWCTCTILGRKRTYFVTREEIPPNPPAA